MKGLKRWASTPKGFSIICVIIILAVPVVHLVDTYLSTYNWSQVVQEGLFSHVWKPLVLGFVLAIIFAIFIYGTKERKQFGKEFKSNYKDDEPNGI